jgi:hypothetical protein
MTFPSGKAYADGTLGFRFSTPLVESVQNQSFKFVKLGAPRFSAPLSVCSKTPSRNRRLARRISPKSQLNLSVLCIGPSRKFE